ncbi:hypothetical protein ACTHGU_09305 [Chitinophagaceae bacterium MMS25-I14]
MKNTSFDLLLSGVPYQVKAEPFAFNTETRFRVSYNSGPESIFAWDAEMQQFKSLDDDGNDIPDDLEQAISDKLKENAPA